MTLELVLWVGGGVVALAVGIWAGLPTKQRKTPEEIEREIQRAILTGVTPRAKRRVPTTPYAWMRWKGRGRSGSGRGPGRRGLHLEAPSERTEKDSRNRPDRGVS